MSGLVFVGLFEGVKAVFAEDGVNACNEFGWQAPQQQKVSQSRICWVPGDPQGKAGKMSPAQNVGQLPSRTLGTLDELFTIYIQTTFRALPHVELEQYKACRDLFDIFWRALYRASYDIGTGGRVQLIDASWDRKRLVRQDGACLHVLIMAPAMIPDTPATLAPTDTDATLDGILVTGTTEDLVEAVTETQTIEAETET
jgi:hypothetical protein